MVEDDLFENKESLESIENSMIKLDGKVEFKEKEIGDWLFERKGEYKSFFCCLVYGLDGTGKTGIIQSYPLKDDEKMIILDLDSGNEPLLVIYNKHKEKNLIIQDPLCLKPTKGLTEIDYIETLNKIRNSVEFIKRNYQKLNIKAICLDGLTTLLKFCEYQMRIEKNINVDGGVNLRYWISRNKLFLETLQQMKSLPIDKFFVSHENFIITADKEVSSVVSNTNQLMFQKLRCIRTNEKEEVIYKVIIDKNKFNVMTEGMEFDFCKVNKKDKSFKWRGDKIFEMLR